MAVACKELQICTDSRSICAQRLFANIAVLRVKRLMLKFNADWQSVGLNFGEAYLVRQWAFNTMISVKFIYTKCRSVLRFQLAKG